MRMFPKCQQRELNPVTAWMAASLHNTKLVFLSFFLSFLCTFVLTAALFGLNSDITVQPQFISILSASYLRIFTEVIKYYVKSFKINFMELSPS
jgi:hypothetical protein